MTISSAYDKMLKSGSAHKPIRIAQPTPDGLGNDQKSPTTLGEVKEDTSWNDFDSKMQEYIETKRTEKPVKQESKSKSKTTTIKKLENRIALLENVVGQLMKTQMDLLKNG